MPIGPSTTQTPYLISLEPNVTFTSILSAGDIVGTHPDGSPRPMVGVPDGIGAFDNGDGTATVMFNHELGAATGAVREHGSTGAFVDKMVINKATLQVLSAEDLGKTVFQDPDGDGVYVNATTAFERLCSADLAPTSAFYNARTNLGTTERIYMAGEETGPPFTPDNGRGWAFVATGADAGKIYELPAAGNISFENLVASPASGNKTVVMETDDTSPLGQVYMYVGTKQAAGNTIEKAGLTNGSLYGVKVNGMLDETNGTVLPGDAATFTMQLMPNAKTETGVQLQADSEAAGASEFLRPEDGAWDPSHPNWFYFNTTASFAGNSLLWRLEFNDIKNPEAGGTIRMMLNGTEGQKMLDNMTVSADGKVTVLEDVGNNAFLGRVLQYDPATDTLVPIGIHDAARFGTPPTAPFNQDEESSGVLDVTSIFGGSDRKAYLLDTQAHYAIAGEVVEGGQLQLMYVDTPRSGGSGNDTINGSGFADDLTGGGGDDVMHTGSGNDMIDGGSGNDVMFGGAGNDSYFVDSGMDGVIENASEGTDTVYSTAHSRLSPEVENLVLLGSGDLQGYGNILSNSINGNSGNNLLDGDAGVDAMYGGIGNDIYFVDNAGDGVVENTGEGSDVVFSTANLMLSPNVETLILQGGADLQGYGNALANTIYGNTGNNLLDGGTAADIMVGRAGDDVYFVDDASDAVVESSGEGNDAVFASANYGLSANVETLLLQGGADLQGYGNGLANSVYGNTGNNLLDGGGAADTMYGGIGNDTYFVDNAGDVVVENTGEGTDAVFATVGQTLSANVETLVLQGAGNLSGTGNALANSIFGNSGDNTLDGGGAADVLTGNAGNDTFVFHMGQGDGDTVVDFAGNGPAAGDSLSFVGYGVGANFTNIDATHWQVNFNGGASHEVITFMNGAAVDPSDVLFS
jgi:Ca2+-binding RTX toxin-like protein